MPHKTWAIGEEVIASDFNPIVADQVVATFPNAANRTSSWAAPPVGAVSHLADSPGVLWVYTGSAWRPLDGGRGEVGYQAQNVVSGAFPGTFTLLLTTTVNVKAGRLYVAHFHGRISVAGASLTQLQLTAVGVQTALYATNAVQNSTVFFEGRYAAPADAAVTFTCNGMNSTGAATLQGTTNDPWYLSVRDVGPTVVVP